jgi:hypothetical protein
MYSLSKEGERAAESLRSNTRWASLTARAEEGEDRVSVGSLLDAFAEGSAVRRRLARTEQRDRIDGFSRARAPRSKARSRKERTMDEFAEMAGREREAKRIARRQWFWLHVAVFVPTQLILSSSGARRARSPVVRLSAPRLGILLAVHGVYAFVMKTPEEIMIERELRQEVSTSTRRA